MLCSCLLYIFDIGWSSWCFTPSLRASMSTCVSTSLAAKSLRHSSPLASLGSCKRSSEQWQRSGYWKLSGISGWKCYLQRVCLPGSALCIRLDLNCDLQQIDNTACSLNHCTIFHRSKGQVKYSNPAPWNETNMFGETQIGYPATRCIQVRPWRNSKSLISSNSPSGKEL